MNVNQGAYSSNIVDYVIVGAGIMGLSIARQLLCQFPQVKIAILEKEAEVGLHASGRNSGVLHSGIYYEKGSLKANFCLQGARAMAAYCDEHQLPIQRTGKVILALKKGDLPILNKLYQRALDNGAKVNLLTADELKEIEPQANLESGQALFSPETSVVDPKAIVLQLYRELLGKKNVTFYFNAICSSIDTRQKEVSIGHQKIAYGHLFNTAGLYADQVARACGLDKRYTIIPFKGLYAELSATSSLQINHLIYPVPDMNVPFLGVHFTKSVTGKVYIGPTAIPALGREHYHGLQGIKIKEALESFVELGSHYIANKQGFRFHTHNEIARFLKTGFIGFARLLVPNLKRSDVVKSQKVGIRAQLFDKIKRELVMDFIVNKTENETHVLNAVSPAFTSAFSFADHVVNLALERELA
jgi:L-2-hydroxyglutarate oxidase LhgO